MKINIHFRDLGTIRYKEAWDIQEELFGRAIEQKRAGERPENNLIFCEHPPVFTLGKSGDQQNLLINEDLLRSKGIEFYRINRGGDITFHGPGQIVGYPIIDLEQFGLGVKSYVHTLEEAVIMTLKDYGIPADRFEGATGVWLDTDIPGKTRKICAIGVRASRHITMHGFAFNVNTELSYYQYINPCGFIDKGISSMETELGNKIDLLEVKERLRINLVNLISNQ